MLPKTLFIIVFLQILFKQTQSKLYLKIVIEKGDAENNDELGLDVTKEANEANNLGQENINGPNKRKLAI